MQAYSQGFAHIYNLRWTVFASQVAPYLFDYYVNTPLGQVDKTMLDLCCGTGQLAKYFLERNFRVIGIDLSEHMLHYAKENCNQYVRSGQANFFQGDASDFKLNERVGLVISTFDALNHLADEDALRSCFKCTLDVCDGYFIFDLNTRSGLRRWNSIQVDEGSEDALIITRGIYDGQSDKAWTRVTGFSRKPDGAYDRFDETAFQYSV